MAFGILSMTNSTPTVLNPVPVAQASSTATGKAAPRATKSTTSAAESPVAAATSAPAQPAAGVHGSGGGGAVAASDASAHLDTATVYTTTVAGKQYSGSVVENDGAYTASVPSLPGATARGATEQAAENNLNARIDELV